MFMNQSSAILEDVLLLLAYFSVVTLVIISLRTKSDTFSTSASAIAIAIGFGLLTYSNRNEAGKDLPRYQNQPRYTNGQDINAFQKEVEAWEKNTRVVAEIRRGADSIHHSESPTHAIAVSIIIAGFSLIAIRSYCSMWSIS